MYVCLKISQHYAWLYGAYKYSYTVLQSSLIFFRYFLAKSLSKRKTHNTASISKANDAFPFHLSKAFLSGAACHTESLLILAMLLVILFSKRTNPG